MAPTTKAATRPRSSWHNSLSATRRLLLRAGRRIRAIVSRTFPLEGAEEAHELLRKNALIGRAALLLAG